MNHTTAETNRTPRKKIQPKPTTEDRIVRIGEVMTITGRSEASIYRDEKAGKFPRRRKIGVQSVGWLLSEIREWVQERMEA